MNIRVALGAQPSQVTTLVTWQGFLPVIIGLGAGIGGALAVSRIVAGLLYDVRAWDPRVLAAVLTTVATIALTACLMAARQGLRPNPASVLRDE
jgi:putative ABC transport system permease protein